MDVVLEFDAISSNWAVGDRIYRLPQGTNANPGAAGPLVAQATGGTIEVRFEAADGIMICDKNTPWSVVTDSPDDYTMYVTAIFAPDAI